MSAKYKAIIDCNCTVAHMMFGYLGSPLCETKTPFQETPGGGTPVLTPPTTGACTIASITSMSA